MKTETIKLIKGDDLHCHLRKGKILDSVAIFTAKQFKRATIMPNTNPPILTAEDAIGYRREITECCWDDDWKDFEPLMTIQITDNTTPAMIIEAKKAGVIAGKVYPQGVTTNSQNGVSNFYNIIGVMREMQKQGMLLLLHGESPNPDIFCLDREKNFLSTPANIAKEFPNLKIVLEHITTKEAVETVTRLNNVAATITVHHLLLTLDDVVGGLISPHNFCKPIAKRPEDKKSLLEAAISENPKFFYGGDSAPHMKEKKECSQGCAGVFNAPVALPLLVQIFEEQNALDRLENFIAKFGANFYGLPQNSETIELVKKDWTVPNEYNGIVPFMAGQTLRWQIAS
jgi:dihydroorotase